MQPGREPEVPLQQGAGTAKQIEELRGWSQRSKAKVKRQKEKEKG
jgi:hypothetical protein